MRKSHLIPLAAMLIAANASAQRGTSEYNSGPAAGGNETGFPSGAEWTHSGPGADFIQVSSSTRTNGIANPNVTCPFSLNIPAPPAGSVIVDAIVSWTYLSNDNPATDPVSINNNAVVGAQLGWGSPDLY